MTRSENMEHVEVLRELRRFAVGKEIGSLDAAIASLSAQQPTAVDEVFSLLREYEDEIDKFLTSQPGGSDNDQENSRE